MHSWSHKSVKEHKSSKNQQNPSFSSSLLDEIYRSMDAGDEKSGEHNLRRDKLAGRPTISNGAVADASGRAKAWSTVEDEEIASLRRASLVEKWMETKVLNRRRKPSSLPEFDRNSVLDNDPVFFSSESSSSDSSFGWFSEPEAFMESRSNKPSCFGPFSKPKPIKTNISSKKKFDDGSYNHRTTKTDQESLIKSKSRALKIYANMKKLKQPISPGGRLTTFLNSLFANGHVKKSSKDSNETKKIERKSKSTHGSTCSSASSFSRSCLSKNSPRSRQKLNNGVRRTVRFYPVSVIVDEDCRPCGEKFISDQDFKKVCATMTVQKKCDYDDEEDDDMGSDSSSDLFELDHLCVFEKEKYCEELPVYETTNFGRNRAIANGLIC